MILEEPVMHALVLININIHTKFEVLIFTHSKHIS